MRRRLAGVALYRCKKDSFIITFDQNLTKRKTKNRKTLVVERFLMVEMRRIELLAICSPVNKMTARRGLSCFLLPKVHRLWTRFVPNFDQR